VIEALRDEPDQDLLARRLASEVALSSVLEKALLLQRTLLTGKKEPNVAANQLAVEAVNHESDTLEQEIRNLKTELELRRELANNSPMAIIQRHGTRAAGSRGIYEGDPVPDRLDRLQKGQPGRHAMSRRGLAAAALAVQPARGEGAAVDGGAHRRRRGRQHRRHLPRRQRCRLGAVAGWPRAGYFLVWRLCLYGATAYGWVWMRRRLLAREEDGASAARLVRSEIAGVVAIVALEASLLMQAR
jgi:hypothetical protein